MSLGLGLGVQHNICNAVPIIGTVEILDDAGNQILDDNGSVIQEDQA